MHQRRPGGGLGGHMETHPLIVGWKQWSNSVTETQERWPLLGLAVPALHHHLVPEKAQTGLVTTLSWAACPAAGIFTMTHHVLPDYDPTVQPRSFLFWQDVRDALDVNDEWLRTRHEVRVPVWTSCIHSWSCCKSLNPRPSQGTECHLQTPTGSHEFIS